MKSLFRIITVFLLFVIIQAHHFNNALAGEIAPNFWISNLEGQQFRSSNQKTPYVISFFFVDCIPCKKEIPQLYELISKKYPGVGLLFIDPVSEDTTNRIRAFAESRNVPTKYFYHDSLGVIARKFGIKAVFPTIVGVKQNRITFRLNDLSERSLSRLKKGL